MSIPDSQTGKLISRTVTPFAPLALALLMSRALLPSSPSEGNPASTESPADLEAAKCDEVMDFKDCHSRYPTGCSQAGNYDPYLNLLKNQLTPPAPPVKYLSAQDYSQLDQGLPPGLNRNNHGDFKAQLAAVGEGQTFGIVGYLYYAIHTGAESSNCELLSTDTEGSNVDYHIGIGFDPRNSHAGQKALEQSGYIVEMTPHYRFFFHNGGWTLTALRQFVGSRVRVQGQLMVDSEHNIGAQDCAVATSAAQHLSCWRASAWELHPITGFDVCPDDSCDETSSKWQSLDQAARPKNTTVSTNSSGQPGGPGRPGRRAGSHLIQGAGTPAATGHPQALREWPLER